MSERLLKIDEVRSRVRLSTSTIYARVKDGSFPLPRRTGRQGVAWVASEIDQWILELPAVDTTAHWHTPFRSADQQGARKPQKAVSAAMGVPEDAGHE